MAFFFAPDYSMFLEHFLVLDKTSKGQSLILPSGIKTTIFLEEMVGSWKRFNKVITIDSGCFILDSIIKEKYDNKTIFLIVEGEKQSTKVRDSIFNQCQAYGSMMIVQSHLGANILKEVHQNQITKALAEFVPQSNKEFKVKKCSCSSLDFFRSGCTCK